jgi:hypothetical protein
MSPFKDKTKTSIHTQIQLTIFAFDECVISEGELKHVDRSRVDQLERKKSNLGVSRGSHLEDHRTVLDVEGKILQVKSTVIFGIEPETFYSIKYAY